MDLSKAKKIQYHKSMANNENTIVNVIYDEDENGTKKISCVPIDNDNTDYQAILKWVAEGNTIEEAD